MARFEDRTFGAGERVALDGNEFVNCRFDGCTIVYAGGSTQLAEIDFRNTRVEFEGPALATFYVVREMATYGEWGANFARKFFDREVTL